MWRRSLVWLAIVGLLGSTGCFGAFNATRQVYDFNQNVHSDRWVRWLTFLGMNIIPVYPAAEIADAVWGNSTEFWTGKNPIPPTDTAQAQPLPGPEAQVASVTPTADGWNVVVVDAENRKQELRIVREGDGVLAYDSNGVLIGRSE